MLATDRPDHPRLTEVHRFHHSWEAEAGLRLREGDLAVIDAYTSHGRVHAGDTESMLEQAYQAWRHDLDRGRNSLLIAANNIQVTTLNGRARVDLQAAGQVAIDREVPLRDGTAASVGDWITTRRNSRNLQTSDGDWVRNGDRWTVSGTHPDGSLTAHRPDHPDARVRLPAVYVGQHVDLGYAITIHRAQGATVDTAHTIASPTMTREQLYVALTRGRHGNRAYVPTDQPTDEPSPESDRVTGHDVIAGIIQRRGTTRSAHEAIAEEQNRWGSTAQLAAEHDTLASTAATSGAVPDEVTTAIVERRRLIQHRADQLLRTAIQERQPWLPHLGRPPADPQHRQTWLVHARTVAAYRDRHAIVDDMPLGRDLPGTSRREGQRQARAAVQALQRLTAPSGPLTRHNNTNSRSGPTM